jgi:GNAT superfamily N-acetyltransferase
MDDVSIRLLAAGGIPVITSAFSALDWHKPAVQYERYLAEQRRGERAVLVSWQGTAFAGYVTVVWHSGYAPFREAGIPEIVDLNVLPSLRRRGIGSRLLEEAERLIAERSAVAGIYADYGAARRLYVKRGYVPDGRGLLYHGRHVARGDTVDIDDGLILYLTKDLRLEA